MLYSIGRLFQLAGLVILPIAIAGEVAQRLDLKESLSLSSVGCLAFLIGWALQQFSGKGG